MLLRCIRVSRQAVKSSIRQYLLQVGHQVKEFDPLLEVQSDKANVEITSPYNGIIGKLYGTGGDMIQVCTEGRISAWQSAFNAFQAANRLLKSPR